MISIVPQRLATPKPMVSIIEKRSNFDELGKPGETLKGHARAPRLTSRELKATIR